MKKRIILVCIIAVIIIGLIGAFIYYSSMQKPVSKSSEEVELKIEPGTSSAGIGSLLKEKGLIKSEFVFKVYAKTNNVNNMQAGDYNLNKNMSLGEIIKKLQDGPDKDKNTINITFLEGKNYRWIAKTIAENTNNSEEEVYSLLEDKEYIDSLINKYWFITNDIKDSNIYYSLEGYLFPDTYNFKNESITVREIFNDMLDQMEQKLSVYKEEIQKSGISVHRLLTMASIVELEASNPDDRATVASVFYNRVKYNMSLGSDVTTYYAVKVDMSERDLKQSELDSKNAYNTRSSTMAGKLPVGPICSVGLKSIEAALKPETTDYLYFVADKNGKVYFAKSKQEQDKNIQSLKSQGLWFKYE